MGAFNLPNCWISYGRNHQLGFIAYNQCYGTSQKALIHYKPESMDSFREFDIHPYGLLCEFALRKRIICSVDLTLGINYSEEGQSVGGPYTVVSLNNCLLQHRSVYGRGEGGSSRNHTQSPKRTNCSLGMLAIHARC